MSDTIRTSRLKGSELIVETRDGVEVYDSRFLVAALLIYVARGSGRIEPEESAQMIAQIQAHFRIESAESFNLLTRAMSELADEPELAPELAKLGQTLSQAEKEDIAVMALRVIAADGRREASEMEHFNTALTAIGATPETIHRAFDRYFEETMPGS